MKKLLMISLSLLMVISSITVTEAATVIDLDVTDGKIASIDYEERNGVNTQAHGSDNVCTGNYDTGRTISYRVNVPKKAGYSLSVNVAHDSRYGGPGDNGLSFTVYCDGVYLGDFSQLLDDTSPNGEDWHIHVLTKIKDFKIGLPEGEHVIMFEANCKNVNIDYWVLTEDGAYIEPPVIGDIEGTGDLIKKDAVNVTASSAVKDGSSEWYTNKFEIPYKNSILENIDIREVDNMDITTIEINPSVTYQEFLGMGTSLEESTINNLSKMSKAKQREILEILVDPVNGMGLTMFRLTIGTSDFTAKEFYTYYDTANGKLVGEPDWENDFSIQKDIDYNIISTVKLLKEIAEEKGVLDEIKFFASPWSPPGWMKESGNYTIDYNKDPKGLVGGQLKDECIDDWAKYLSRFIEEYAKQGIDIYAITLQNEPQARVAYPCCYISPKQEAAISIAFKKYLNKSTVLTNDQKEVKVWGWDHNPDNLVSYMSEAYSYENALDGAAVHDYSGSYSNMSTLHNAYPNKEMHLSERSVWGVQGIDNIMQYFGNYCESYTMWVTMLDSNRNTHQWPGNPDPSLFIQNANDTEDYWATPEVYLFGQISKYVRPGYVRINSTYNADTNIKTVAFKDEDTGKCVLVVVNKGALKENIAVVVGNGQFTTSLEGKTVATYIFNENDFPVDTRTPLEIDNPISFVDDSNEIYNASVDSGLNSLGNVKANGGANFYINVPESGYYNVYVDLAVGYTGSRALSLKYDGSLLQTIYVNQADQSGDHKEWDVFRTVKFQTYLTKGKHDLDIVADNGDINLKTLNFEKIDETSHNLPTTIKGKDYVIGNGVFVEGDYVTSVSMNNWTNRWDTLTYELDIPVTAKYTITINAHNVNANAGFWFDLYENAYNSNKYSAGNNEIKLNDSTKVEEGVYSFEMTGELKKGITYFEIKPIDGASFDVESITFTTNAAYDKSALKSLIIQVQNTDGSEYTVETFETFNKALTRAIQVRDEEPGLQADVDKAYNELKLAYESLVLALTPIEIDNPISFVDDNHKYYNASIDTTLHCLGNVKANGGAYFYTNIPETGYYDVYVELAAGYTNEKPLSYKLDGNIIQTINVNQADQSASHIEWYDFRTVKFHVYLEKGVHDVDIIAGSGDINLKTLTYKKSTEAQDISNTILGKDYAIADGVFIEGDSVKYIDMNNWNTRWDNVAYAINIPETTTYVITVKGEVVKGDGFWFDLYDGTFNSNKYTAGNNEFSFSNTKIEDGVYTFVMNGELRKGITYFNICPFDSASFNIDSITFVTKAAYDKLNELKTLIDEVKETVKDDYVEDSYTIFENALNNAIGLSSKLNISESEVNSTITLLKAAYNNLVLKAKIDLETLLEYAHNISRDTYSKQTYDALVVEMINSKKVLDDLNSTKNDYLTSYDSLQLAINNLLIDKSELKNDLNQYSSITEEKYTEESYKEFNNALKEAMKVYLDDEAIQKEIDEVRQLLKDKYNALKEKVTIEDESPSDDTIVDTSDNNPMLMLTLLSVMSFVLFTYLKKKELK